MRGVLTAIVVLCAFAAPAQAQLEEATPAASARRGTLQHVPGRRHEIWLGDGDHLDVGTCGVDGSRVEGDTVLRLRDHTGREVAFDDDGCFEGLGSRIRYHVPRGGAGVYTVTALCYHGGKCGGQIAYEVEDRGVPDLGTGVWMSANARGLLGVDDAGGGLLGDLTLELRTVAPIVFRLEAGPIGIAGGENGALLGGAAQLTVLLDWDWAAVGVGLGIGVLGPRRMTLPQQQEAMLFGLRARLGPPEGFYISGELRGALVADEIRTHSLRVEARLPLGDVDLLVRGAGGDEGVMLGEAAAVFWVDRAPNRPRLGVSVSAGAGAVFYEPLCRFGNPCGQASWYAGPTVGAGLEWRP